MDEAYQKYVHKGQRPEEEKEEWDEVWQAAFLTKEIVAGVLTDDTPIKQFQRAFHCYKRGVERLEKKMTTDSISGWKKSGQQALMKGKQNEIKRWLGKLPPRVTFAKLGARDRKRQYPSLLTTDNSGILALQRFLGAGFRRLHMETGDWIGKNWWTYQSDGTEVHMRREGLRWQVILSPLHRLTDFLRHLEEGENMDLHLELAPPRPAAVYTTAVDKFSQLEYAIQLESTALSRRCVGCGGNNVLPLSKVEGKQREVLWWCCDCKGSTRLQFRGAVMSDKLNHLIEGIRTFDGRPFLNKTLTPKGMATLKGRLRSGTQPGKDGVHYEMIKGAPGAVGDLYRDVLNDYLQGGAIDADLKKQMVCMLHKREPAHFIENMRPVTLLNTTYKGYTSLLDSRFKTEMELQKVQETAQTGFRGGHQIHDPIVKVQYILSEAERRKSKVYLVYLDWYSAFCSIDLERLYLLMGLMGMHADDVNLIREAHRDAWVTVRTPFGETARIQVTRGTPQGDALSPTLFIFFLNLCLRHLNDAGVGFTHACGVRRNNTTFADDICIVGTAAKDMNKLLTKVAEFAEWAGMDLCVFKCEVTG